MSVVDIAFIMFVLFASAIAGLVIHYTVGNVVTEIVNTDVINSSPEAVSAFNSSITTTNRLDLVFLAIFIGLIIAFIITGWYIPTNTIFMAMYWIITLVIVTVSVILSNVWESISQGGSPLTSSLTSLPITNYVLLHLPIFMSIIGFIGIIVMYAKPKDQKLIY